MKNKVNVERECDLLCISINHFEVLGYRARFVEDRTTDDKRGRRRLFAYFRLIPEVRRLPLMEVPERRSTEAIRRRTRLTKRQSRIGGSVTLRPYMDSTNASTGAYLFSVY